jgi:hypothetical protein
MGSEYDSDTILNQFKESTNERTIQEFIAARALDSTPGPAAAGLTALSLRSDAATRHCIERLMHAIQAFNDSSDRYARRILVVTWVLVFLALFQAIPLLGGLIRWLSQQK